MTLNPFIVWITFALLAGLVRRDRRLLAVLPAAGFGLLVVLVAGLAAWRLILVPGPLTESDAERLHVSLVLAGSFGLLPLVAWLRTLVRQDLPRLLSGIRGQRGWVLGCLLLAAAAATAYGLLGREFLRAGAFADYDTLFWSDPNRYLNIFDGSAPAHEQVTHKHPLIPLIGGAMYRLAAPLAGHDGGAVAVSSVAGGLSLLLAAGYFRRVTGSRVLALLLTGVLATSASQVVFSAVPESYAISGLTLILLHLLVAARSCTWQRPRHWVLASALAVGATVTNAVPALVCLLAARAGRRRARVWWWVTRVTLLLAVGMSVQDYLLPASALGMAPKEYANESSYVLGEARAAGWLSQLARGLWLENVAAPSPMIAQTTPHVAIGLGRYDQPWSLLGAGAWLGVTVLAMIGLVRSGDRRPTLVAAAICLAASGLVYSIYGREHLFLYSCQFTFLAVAIVAHGLTHLPRRTGVVALVVLIGSLIAGNWWFLAQMIQLAREAGV